MGRVDAFFLPLAQGNRFCLLHAPAEGVAARGAVVYVHPFAEEMNNSRRMAALQSRAFAGAGWTVLQIDLLGCGDSSGDFAEAAWQRWVDDVVEAAAWLRVKTQRQPVLWGLRAGCLLSARAAGLMQPAADLILWQPVLSGKQFLQQFLRLKIASEIVAQATGKRGGTRELHEKLVLGESVEVAGYSVSPGLALGMEAAELELPPEGTRIAWLEVRGSQDGDLSPASRARIEEWRHAGHQVDAHVAQGAAFWQMPDAGGCAELIERTLDAVDAWPR